MPGGWWLDGLLIGILVALTVALVFDWRPVLAVDIWVRDLSSEHRPYWPDTIAINLERMGQGGPAAFTCLVIASVLGWRRRTIEPAITVLAAFFMSYGTIGIIKVTTDRPMPYRGSVEMFTAPEQLAYPSGHASNGVLWYGMLIVLLGHLMWPWLKTFLRWFPPIVVSFTTVYLGHHWVTDVIAGVAIGIVIERVARRRLWREMPWLMRLLRLAPKDTAGTSGTSGDSPDSSGPSDSGSDLAEDSSGSSDVRSGEPSEDPPNGPKPSRQSITA